MSIINVNYNGYDFQIDPSRPHLRFKGKRPRAPKALSPVATPREVDDEVKLKDIERRRQRVQTGGIAGTLLSRNQASSGGGATLLGRSSNA